MFIVVFRFCLPPFATAVLPSHLSFALPFIFRTSCQYIFFPLNTLLVADLLGARIIEREFIASRMKAAQKLRVVRLELEQKRVHVSHRESGCRSGTHSQLFRRRVRREKTRREA